MMKTTGVLRWMNIFWCLNDDDMDVEEDEEEVEKDDDDDDDDGDDDDDEDYWGAAGRKTQRVAEHPLVGTLSGQIAHILISHQSDDDKAG